MAINMSYCRFENTLTALRECAQFLGEEINPFDQLSDSERAACKRLMKLCRDLGDDYADME